MLKVNFDAYGSYVTDQLYQWDTNRILTITGLDLASVPEIHYSNVLMEKSLAREGSITGDVITAEIPNTLLQAPYPISAHIGVWEWGSFRTIETVVIPVIPRPRPADYVFEDTAGEIYSFNELENRIANIVADASDMAGNTELADVRRGYDGTKYASAGVAVRTQIKKIADDIEALNEGGLALKDEVIGEQVAEWLNENPEATTTVQDGSLGLAKFSPEAVDYLNKYAVKEYVTPEMFGAVGDGVTDDTGAFKDMLAFSNSFTAISCENKTYCISETLTLKPYQRFIFNGATLKAVNEMDYLLSIDTSDNGRGNLEQIRLDCNKLTGGIYVKYATTYTLNNVTIQNFNTYGIYVEQGNIIMHNCFIVNFDNNDSIGIALYGTDSKIYDVLIRNCRTAILNNNGINYFTSVHGWLDSNFLTDDSVYFYTKGQASLINCYSDTYNVSIINDNNQSIYVEGFKVYINPNIYNVVATKEPIFIKFVQTVNDKDVYPMGASNTYLYSFNLGMSSDFDPIFSNCDINDIMKYLPLKKIGHNKNPFGLKDYYEGILSDLNDSFTFARAIYREYDDKVEIDIRVTPNVTDFELNSRVTLCTLPIETAEKWFVSHMGGSSGSYFKFIPIRVMNDGSSNAISVIFDETPQKYAITFNEILTK